jgi:hypothetical protein
VIRTRDPDTAFKSEYGSVSNQDPGFDDQKLEKLQLKNVIFLGSKTTIYFSLGLQKGRPSYRRSLQPTKENIQHFKTRNFLIVSYFCG